VAAGSDAPVAPADALAAVRAAVTRASRSGAVLPGTGLDPERAAALVTAAAAHAAGADAELGRIAPGRVADLVVLTAEPHRPEARVEMTVIGGEVRWRRRTPAGAGPS
jgi:predicted amidohydrolase YtcJ